MSIVGIVGHWDACSSRRRIMMNILNLLLLLLKVAIYWLILSQIKKEWVNSDKRVKQQYRLKPAYFHWQANNCQRDEFPTPTRKKHPELHLQRYSLRNFLPVKKYIKWKCTCTKSHKCRIEREMTNHHSSNQLLHLSKGEVASNTSKDNSSIALLNNLFHYGFDLICYH